MINSSVKERLRRKKVLIVLDDLNDPDQLEILAGDHDLFGIGSGIIVTTRDAQVLRERVDESYELKGLNFEESLQVFYLNAFKRNPPTVDGMKLLERVVDYANGIPLALKVLGSFLRSRKKENWESELNKLKIIRNEKIYSVLRISYDGLDRLEKSIFIDIICFFKAIDCRRQVESILGGRDSFVHIGIDNLIDKSLITIDEDHYLQMHDLIQEMGWEIIRQQSFEEPGKRSRLWLSKDVYNVLKNNTGTEAIEGIYLNLNVNSDFQEVQLSPTIFKKMFKLRLLGIFGGKNYQIQFPQGLEYLPDTLQCLTWFDCPLRSLPSKFRPHNLVRLWLTSSQLEQLWDGVQNLKNLKHFHLDGSKRLLKIPDLSRAPNLETVDLSRCTSLCQVSLLRFRKYDPNYCTCNREDSPEWSPGYLSFSGCYNLEILPDIFGGVYELHLASTSIKQLPSSIWSLDSLERLDLSNCDLLANLPSSICDLLSLKYLNLRGCVSIDKFPELPRNIVTVDLSETLLEQVPSTHIEFLSSLEELHLDYCKELVSLPTNICKMKSLKRLQLYGCENLEIFQEIIEPMECLEILNLGGTKIRVLPKSIENLLGLLELILDGCQNLESIPNITNLNRLRKISLSKCQNLKTKPSLPNGLQSLTLSHLGHHCNVSEICDGLGCFSSLETLDLSGNIFHGIPNSIKELSKLISFHVCNCKNLKSLPKLPLSLEFLDATGCTSLKTIANSRTELMTVGRWDASHLSRSKEFLFYNCFHLDQKTRHNIMIEFQLQTLHTAIVSVFNPKLLKEIKDPRVSVCCPGDKIPKWFSYQSEGSSINIKIPSHWSNTANFLGFALCVVIAYEEYHFDGRYLRLCSQLHFKTSRGKSYNFVSDFIRHWDDDDDDDYSMKDITILNSDHLVMWYEPRNYRDHLDEGEGSFTFKSSYHWERVRGNSNINGVEYAHYISKMQRKLASFIINIY